MQEDWKKWKETNYDLSKLKKKTRKIQTDMKLCKNKAIYPERITQWTYMTQKVKKLKQKKQKIKSLWGSKQQKKRNTTYE